MGDRKMPLTSPSVACCANRFVGYLNAKRDLAKWSRLLARQLHRDAKATPKQMAVIEQLRENIAQAERDFWEHLDDQTIAHGEPEVSWFTSKKETV